MGFQDGRRADPKSDEVSSSGRALGISAVDAHRRWGFVESSLSEWKDIGLDTYDEKRCQVVYMKKVLADTIGYGQVLSCQTRQTSLPSPHSEMKTLFLD